MISLKSCARCGGDVMPEEILGDVELVCLQCGHRTSAPAEAPRYRVVRRRPQAPARRAA
jgi:DNA-directed RNA polymerase subunit RPC12/RpoP